MPWRRIWNTSISTPWPKSRCGTTTVRLLLISKDIQDKNTDTLWQLKILMLALTSFCSSELSLHFSHRKDREAATVPSAGRCHCHCLFQAVLYQVRFPYFIFWSGIQLKLAIGMDSSEAIGCPGSPSSCHERGRNSWLILNCLLLTTHRNSIRSTDPSLVAATCIYLACKIEECPQHIKHIIQEMKHALASK